MEKTPATNLLEQIILSSTEENAREWAWREYEAQQGKQLDSVARPDGSRLLRPSGLEAFRPADNTSSTRAPGEIDNFGLGGVQGSD